MSRLFIILIFIISFSSFAQNMSMRDDQEKKDESVIGSLIPNFSVSKELILGKILGSFLQNYHLTKKTIDDDLSKKAYKLFLERVDYGKQFLLEEDIQKLQKYEDKFDDELGSGKLDVSDLSSKLVKARIKVIKDFVAKRLKKPFDFDKDEAYETDREKREYHEDLDDLKDHWRRSLKYDVIVEYLSLKDDQNGVDLDSKDKKKKEKAKQAKKELKKLSDMDLRAKAREKVAKRYSKFFKRLMKERKSDKLDKFYNSISRVYDPHTHYFVPEEKEDFDIEMTGKLQGIGALLREEGSYIKVERIIPGSASWKGKELKAEDTILGVAQGEDDFVDIVDMSIRDAVKLIRGKKGTLVRLKVQRPGGENKTIRIIRDEVVLEESYVKGATLEVDGVKGKFGYIKVPKFYRDFDNPSGRNSSTDVKNELLKLKKQKDLKGMILDLRGNGGGALLDATLMSGLFIPKGPIVQVKSSTGKKEVHRDTDGKTYYSDKLIVLVDRFSASASEIVAAALQDYDRALIVGAGERTHGKGTVQAVMDLDSSTPMARPFSPLGAVKITIQMFYRISGGSTQFKGVTPDIQLPDSFGYLDSGEQSLDYAIPYHEISKVKFKRWTKSKIPTPKLLSLSKARVAKSEPFKKMMSHVDWYKERKEKTLRSLKLKDMIQFRKEANDMADKLENLFENKALKVGLLEQQKSEVDKERAKEFREAMSKDLVLKETLNIFEDWLRS